MFKSIFVSLITLFFLINTFAAEAEQQKIHRYTVKGIIISLPDARRTSKQIMIRHERIPDYVDETGAVVGMNAMTMPFLISESVNLESYAVNDKVEFEFESWWKPKPGDRIISIRKIE